MKRVTTSEARNNLSRLLAFVRRGGRVRILDRDLPVADLVPADVGEDPEDEWGAVRRGVARPGAGGPPDPELLRPGPRLRGPARGTRAVEALLEERRGGR